MWALGLAAALTGCQTWRSYRADAGTREDNAAIKLDRNQPVLTSATLGGRDGRIVLATANPQTVVRNGFVPSSRSLELVVGQRFRTRVSAQSENLGAGADALIGFDAFKGRKITVDYAKGLLTIAESNQPAPADMHVTRFDDIPRVSIVVNERQYEAVVDSSLPDTLIVPASTRARGPASVSIRGSDLGVVDVQFAPVAVARLGNRLLAQFLVTIDYSKKWIGLWPDPRFSPIVPGQPDLSAH